jgi:hypothetical protein
VSGRGNPLRRTIARKRRSRPVSVRASRPRTLRMRDIPGLGPSRETLARSASGSTRSSRSASLIACSTCQSPEQTAKSTSVETGSVTGIPDTSRRCAGPRSRRLCTRIPGRRRKVAAVTSIACLAANRRGWSAGQHSPHPAPLLAHFRPPDGVDPAPQRMQATLRNAMFYRAGAEPDLEQLGPGHHSMLSADQAPSPSRQILLLCPHDRGDKAATCRTRPPWGGWRRGLGAIWGLGGGLGRPLLGSRSP